MRPIRSMNIEVSAICNLNCSFCYFNKMKKDKRKKPLSNDQIKQAIDILSRMPRMDLFRLGFIGGEPFLNKDLLDLCKYASEKIDYPEIITNGTIATKEKLEEIKKYISGIQVSIDSPYPELHNFLRGNVSGAWEKAMDCLQWCFALNIPRTVTFTVSKNNFCYLKDMLNLSRKFGAELKILHCIPYDIKQRMHTITPEQNQYLCKFIHRYKLVSDTPLQSIITGKDNRCDSGINRLAIDSFGNVKPCDFVPRTFGNILKEPLGIIMEQMREWRNYNFKQSRKVCDRCRNFVNCYGGCQGFIEATQQYKDVGCWV